MKKIAIKGDIFIKIGLILLSLLLFFILSWLGYSFFSMKGDSPRGYPLVDRSDDKLSEMVPGVFSKLNGNYIEYYYKVVPYQISEQGDEYVLYLYADDFLQKYDDIENAKFTYTLRKEKEEGRYDFYTLEWDEPIYIVTRYRLNKDLKYFFEYTIFLLKDVYHRNIVKDYHVFESDTYLVEREMINWEVKTIDTADVE